jgi:hypothetical protein
LQTNENKSKEYDEVLEDLKDLEANACAAAKASMKSKENNTHCVSTTPLFLDLFPCSRNNTYLCFDTNLSIVVGHWNKSRTACHQQVKNDEIMHMFAIPIVYIRMPLWPLPFTTMGRQGYDAALKMSLSREQLKCNKGRMMRISHTWIQPHHHRAILRHILNTVNLFQITLSIDFENILPPDNLIIVRNHGDDDEDVGESFRGVEDQHGHPIQVGDQPNSKFQSLISNLTQSSGPPCIQIDTQDAYEIGFGRSTYARK